MIRQHSEKQFDRVGNALAASGHSVHTLPTDISDRSSVDVLPRIADEMGGIVAIAYKAGVSAATSGALRILGVNLLGTVHVIDDFEPLASRGTSLVVLR